MASPDNPLKILLVANSGWYLYNYRRALADDLRARGAEVALVCPADAYAGRLREQGYRVIEWSLCRAGMHPWQEWRALRALEELYRRERPSLVHHFTIKPVLYGTSAARRSGVPAVVNSVTGLGHVFLSDSRRMRMLRPWLRRWYLRSLRGRGLRAIFQNVADLTALWPEATAAELAHCRLVPGSGVDLSRFHPPDEDGPADSTAAQRPDEANSGDENRGHTGGTVPIVLWAGRLLEEKGLREFVEAARMCRNGRGVSPARFVVCGAPDPGNPSTIPVSEVRRWRDEGVVEWHGHVDDIATWFRRAAVVVVSSYREGLSRTILEAAASGKPVVASDVPGCRDAVLDGRTGILVPPRDPGALADAVCRLLHDPAQARAMGTSARRHVARFDERRIRQAILDIYDDVLRIQATPTMRPPQDAGPTPSGLFTISLDLELAWGTRGRPVARHIGPFLQGTRRAIAGMLELFEKYRISATWAVVGGLLLGTGRSERHPWLPSDEFADIPPGDCRSHPQWYGEDIIERLQSCTVRQEIACHTLWHRFVDSSPAGRAPFRDDLARCLELFEAHGLERPRTFIFPKAQMGHFDVLAELGFRCFRGAEPGWFERLPGERLRAGFRLLDARLAIPPRTDQPRFTRDGLWRIPSSQFYSPFLRVGRYVSLEARVRKARRGLQRAGLRGGVFHLWTHPFNLGCRTDELLSGLEQILQEADRLRRAGRLRIAPMGEIAGELDRRLFALSDGTSIGAEMNSQPELLPACAR